MSDNHKQHGAEGRRGQPLGQTGRDWRFIIGESGGQTFREVLKCLEYKPVNNGCVCPEKQSKFPFPSTRSCLSLAALLSCPRSRRCFLFLPLYWIRSVVFIPKKQTYQDAAFEAAFTSNVMDKLYWRSVENVAS